MPTFNLSVNKLACAAALAGVCVNVNAATTDLGTLPIGLSQFSGTILTDGSATPFGDIVEFILPASGASAYSVINLPLNVPGVADFNVNFSSMGLWTKGLDGTISPDDVRVAFTEGVSVSQLGFNFAATATPAPMYLLINGLAVGTGGSALNGGIYSGAINVSAVPESEVWAMMLVGMGLVGFQLRRKSKQASVNRFA